MTREEKKLLKKRYLEENKSKNGSVFNWIVEYNKKALEKAEELLKDDIEDSSTNEDVYEDISDSDNTSTSLSNRKKGLFSGISNIFNHKSEKKEIYSLEAPRDFSLAKDRLRRLLDQTTTDIELDRVETSGGLFGWFDHKVTGDELNSLTSEIQKYLISFNTTNGNFISEFKSVYDLIDSLDKEYIPGIVGAVKAAEEASNQANKANEDIKKIIDSQEKTLGVLVKYKKQLEELKHLQNIDEIWRGLKDFEKEIEKLNKRHEDAYKQLKSTDKKVLKIACQKHIYEIDSIWKKVTRTLQDIESIHNLLNESRLKITENERKIDEIKNADIIRDEKIKKLDSKCIELELFRTNAEKQKYLFKIDELWDCNEQNQSRIQKNTSAIDSMNRNINQISETEREFDEFKESLKKQKYLFEIDSLFAKNEDVEKNLEITKNEIDELKNGIKSLTETNNVQITKMKKNLLYTKIVCGVAVTGQVVTLVLSILGII